MYIYRGVYINIYKYIYIYIYIYIRGIYTSYSVKPPFVKTVWLPESGEPTQDKKTTLFMT